MFEFGIGESATCAVEDRLSAFSSRAGRVPAQPAPRQNPPTDSVIFKAVFVNAGPGPGTEKVVMSEVVSALFYVI
jgi:hypothetical protein